jgi:predicted outer membrane lipoprotein
LLGLLGLAVLLGMAFGVLAALALPLRDFLAGGVVESFQRLGRALPIF